MWIHYIGGLGKADKIVCITIGASFDPKGQVKVLQKTSPFKLRLLGVEVGNQDDAENIQSKFKSARMYGIWFKATDELQTYVSALEPIKSLRPLPTRVSLDLPVGEVKDMEECARLLGLGTKTRFLRKAARFYIQVGQLKARGWKIQAIKGHQVVQFRDTELPEDLNDG